MAMKKSIGEQVFDCFNHVLIGIIMFTTLYPFIYVVFASISDPVYVAQNVGIMLYPKGVSLAAYKEVFKNPMIGIGYFNTIKYMVLGTLINIIMTSFGAYVDVK